jgi:hypothetical protein
VTEKRQNPPFTAPQVSGAVRDPISPLRRASKVG